MDSRHGITAATVLVIVVVVLLNIVSLSAAAVADPPQQRDNLVGRRQLDEIRTRIIRSLGLTREPDLTKVNVTVQEREEAYRLYHQQRMLQQNVQYHNIQTREVHHQQQQQQQQQQPSQENGVNDDHNNKNVEEEQEESEEDDDDDDDEEEEEENSDEDDESSLEPLVTQQVFSFEAVGVTSSASTFGDLEPEVLDEIGNEDNSTDNNNNNNGTNGTRPPSLAADSASVHFPVTLNFRVHVPRLGNVSSVTLRLLKDLKGPHATHARPVLATLRVLKVQDSAVIGQWPPQPPTLVAAQRVIVRGAEWETIDLSPLVATLADHASAEDHHEHNHHHHHHHRRQQHRLRLRVECDDCGPLTLGVGEELVREGYGEKEISSTAEKVDEMVPSTPASLLPQQEEQQAKSSQSPTLDVRVNLESSWTASSLSTVRRKRWTKHPRRRKSSSPSTSAPSSKTARLQFEKDSFRGRANCTGHKGKCCRHRMYVNFTQLKMEFVVEPSGFEAFICKGKCPYHFNPAHTHALIQSSMHALKKAPRPCCAPSKLSNLVIMHYDENSKLKVTNWTNAIVEECACA